MGERKSGILMHISSLPSEYGIGDFGKKAYEFVDFLNETGQKLWQILPMGPTGYGDSPYQSYSAFAGNYLFIDMEEFVRDEYIKDSDLDKLRGLNYDDNLDYGQVKIEKETFQKLNTVLEYTYPHQLATTIPTMTSVTKIKQNQLNNEIETIKQNQLNNEIKSKSEIKIENQAENKAENQLTFHKPNFLREDIEEVITPAQKGTLIHLCMQRLDEAKDYTLESIKMLIQDFEKRKMITEKEAKAINPYKILAFTKSVIWEALKTAKKVYKERPFFINIPAKEIYGEEELEEEILVQGIIDLYYINQNDEIILVDYKTDYVETGKESELIEKYITQLELYKRALEESLQRKVSKTYIYSVYLEKEIEVG